MQYTPGSAAELEATFTDSYGRPVDPDTIYVDIYDANGVQIIDNADPVRLGLGTYQYTLPLPSDAPEGLWRIEWQAIVNGLNAFGETIFEVAAAGVNVNPSESIMHSRLRSRLGETSKLPTDQNGSDTMFTTEQIADLLAYAGGDLNLATYEGWKRKVAHLSRLIDIAESGSDRLLSQRFRQARSMLEFWGGIVSDTDSARADAMTGRIVGSVINLRGTGREDPNPGTPFSGYVDHIRMYPTKRLLIPAILG